MAKHITLCSLVRLLSILGTCGGDIAGEAELVSHSAVSVVAQLASCTSQSLPLRRSESAEVAMKTWWASESAPVPVKCALSGLVLKRTGIFHKGCLDHSPTEELILDLDSHILISAEALGELTQA